MGGSLLSKAEVPGSSLLGHLPKEFSLRLTWCPWLVGYYGTRGISRGARKLARTPLLSKKKKNFLHWQNQMTDRKSEQYMIETIHTVKSKTAL